jgi:DNA-binding NarL/FixJ family response regulator
VKGSQKLLKVLSVGLSVARDFSSCAAFFPEGILSQASRSDVIVTDFNMPILNGIDAGHKLRASGSAAKILFLTVHGERKFVEACMEAGALGYLQKSSMKHCLIGSKFNFLIN